MGILAFLIILSLLVFVHELGHFFTARKLGVAVEEFGFGLPPRAFGKKIGATIYSINWIPLGGFVRIKGEQGENPDDTDSFIGRPIWQRSIIISAGVIMNALFAAFLLAIGFTIGTPQLLDGVDTSGATITNQEIRVASVLEDFPAASAQIETGDVILTVDQVTMSSIALMQDTLRDKRGDSIEVVLERDGELLTKQIETVIYNEDTKRAVIGVELITTGIVSYPVHLALLKGITTTGVLLKDITFAFGQVIHDVVVGDDVSVDLAGPVGIAVITKQITELGFIYLIQFAAILSINLAIINFIPFPALDGGRFLFLMIEKIKGSAVNQKVETIMHNIGFGLLMVLILLVTIRDLSNISFWDKFSGIL